MSHEQISLNSDVIESLKEQFAEEQFADNPEPRCPVVLIYDCSTSMWGMNGDDPKMRELMRGHELLQDELVKDPVARERAEISYITYGTQVSEPTLFTTPGEINDIQIAEADPTKDTTHYKYLNTQPVFTDMVTTSTNQALLTAIETIEKRLEKYGSHPHYAPMIFLVTDGMATDHNAPAPNGNQTLLGYTINRLNEHIQRDEQGRPKKGSWVFLPVYIPTGDPQTDQKIKQSLSIYPSLPAPEAQPLEPGNILQFFKWISQSVQNRSNSRTEEALSFPSTSEWLMPSM